MTAKLKVVRLMRSLALAVVFLYFLYAFFFGAEYLAGIKLPGWISVSVFFVLALVLIGGFIFDREGLYWWLQALGFGQVQQIKQLEVRRSEYREVAQNLNLTLHSFTQKCLKDAELQDLEYSWPMDPAEDVERCCKDFARMLKDGIDPTVLELLYWGSRKGEDIQRKLWPKASTPQRKKLACILAKSEQLAVFDDTEETVSALEWIFGRIDRFDVRLVKSEISALVTLWRHLNDYAAHLDRSGLSHVIPDLSGPVELDRIRSEVALKFGSVLLSQAKYEELADYLLRKRGQEWICAWDKTLATSVAGSLAVVSLGVFTAETGDIRSPLMLSLSTSIARDANALEVLFGYLWRKSKCNSNISAAADLRALADWANSVDDAKLEMGEEIYPEVRNKLQVELARGQWLPWLPIEPAMRRIVEQSQQAYESLKKLESAQVEDKGWKQDLKKLVDQIGMKIDFTSLDRNKILIMVREALNNKYAIPGGHTPTNAQEVEADLKEFAATAVRPETKWVGYLVKYQTVLDTLELFGERTTELKRQLIELGNEIEAEAAGGAAYLITFDQTRGPLADLIDLLKEKYNLKRYTRYSRIGKLKPGKSFESFYREFETDLEELIEAATHPGFEKMLAVVGRSKGASNDEIDRVVSAIKYSPHWEQVEITVQQFSDLHRHDFIRDAKFQRTIRKDFRIPPTPEVSAQALGLN